MGSRKEVLIVFPDSWIKFAPSVLNFAEMLRVNNFESVVLFYSSGDFATDELPFCHKAAVLGRLADRLLSKLRIIKAVKLFLLVYHAIKLRREHNFIGAVGYDDIGYCCTWLLGLKSLYFSLEVNRTLCNRIIFSCSNPWLIIQSRERKDYLAPKLADDRVMYIQNSPIVPKEVFENLTSKDFHSRRGLIYFGLLKQEHEVESCIDLAYRSNEPITIKYFVANGSLKDLQYVKHLKERYKDLIQKGRVIFDDSYIAQDRITDYLSNFRIGLGLYLQSIINSSFNYASSPSGKVFNYLTAGIPVIVNDTIGFHFVSDYQVGIQVANTDSDEILEAINTIEERYDFYAHNALEIGERIAYNTMFDKNKEKIFKNVWQCL
ncbi:MAG: hypothetical protein ACTTH5_00215 [Wolinella sp.]